VNINSEPEDSNEGLTQRLSCQFSGNTHYRFEPLQIQLSQQEQRALEIQIQETQQALKELREGCTNLETDLHRKKIMRHKWLLMGQLHSKLPEAALRKVV